MVTLPHVKWIGHLFYPEMLSQPKAEDNRGMEVLCLGLSRTGTMSVSVALKRLVKGPIYHGIEVFIGEDRDMEYWLKAFQGRMTAADWRDFLGSYKGGTDVPLIFFYKEVLTAFPECKVIFMERDATSWFRSWQATYRRVAQFDEAPIIWFNQLIDSPRRRKVRQQLYHCKIPGSDVTIADTLEDEEKAVKLYDEWKTEILANVPASRILHYRVTDGWDPLCKFLGYPVPEDEAFPRVNDAKTMQTMLSALQGVSWFACMLIALMCFVFLGHFNTIMNI